jgi:bacterioferritin-associated ferredoxin
MYVCLCNGLNEAKVREAIESGARSVAGVYQRLDCAPVCGKCTPYIREMLRQQLPVHEVDSSPTAAA